MTIKAKRKSGLSHCCHHGEHWEFCFDFDKRVEFIKNHKPQDEQELRLKLFHLVPDELLPGKNSPEYNTFLQAEIAFEEAWEACNEAGVNYMRAKEPYEKARKVREEAMIVCSKAWEAYEKAETAYNEAKTAYYKAWIDYIQTWGKELMELHDRLFPDCPWDGETIFKK